MTWWQISIRLWKQNTSPTTQFPGHTTLMTSAGVKVAISSTSSLWNKYSSGGQLCWRPGEETWPDDDTLSSHSPDLSSSSWSSCHPRRSRNLKDGNSTLGILLLLPLKHRISAKSQVEKRCCAVNLNTTVTPDLIFFGLQKYLLCFASSGDKGFLSAAHYTFHYWLTPQVWPKVSGSEGITFG